MTETRKQDAVTESVKELHRCLEQAEAVVIGAGSGLSAAAGFTYSGKRFEEHFREFIEKYGMTDMYSAGFYPFASQEENGPIGAGTFITIVMTSPPVLHIRSCFPL